MEQLLNRELQVFILLRQLIANFIELHHGVRLLFNVGFSRLQLLVQFLAIFQESLNQRVTFIKIRRQ